MNIQFETARGDALPLNDFLELTQYEAYLYDCDGTLASTMEPHKAAWVAELQSHLPSDAQSSAELKIRAIIDELAGMPAVQTISVMNERFGWSLDPHSIARKKEERFLAEYVHLAIGIAPVVEHLKKMHGLGKQIGVVSGGRTRVVSRTLELLGVRGLVSSLVCAEDVTIGKPHPEPFLMAARQLEVRPDRCLVLEDADFGIQAARAAGMDWIRVIEA